MTAILVNLAVEDTVSETVLRKILNESSRKYLVGSCYCRGGFGYLKKNIGSFNAAARNTPFLVLTDLDDAECAPVKIKSWLPGPKHPNLIFRIAIQEVEAWLLADREHFANFLAVSKDNIPTNLDELPKPKDYLISLARKSKKRIYREDIAPRIGSTAKQGPDYNRHLVDFINNHWSLKKAAVNSGSLRRTIDAINNFTQTH
jgi:Domain of unknown function (DUF4276)